MADDKSKTKQDRKLVSGEEPYEVAAFARKYGTAKRGRNHHQALRPLEEEARRAYG
nr:hypothetical protein [Mesorhizobium sp.]